MTNDLNILTYLISECFPRKDSSFSMIKLLFKKESSGLDRFWYYVVPQRHASMALLVHGIALYQKETLHSTVESIMTNTLFLSEIL